MIKTGKSRPIVLGAITTAVVCWLVIALPLVCGRAAAQNTPDIFLRRASSGGPGVLTAVFPAGNIPSDDGSAISFEHPVEGTVFPRNFASPTIKWKDGDPRVTNWLVRIEVDGEDVISMECTEQTWVPARQSWEAFKEASVGKTATIVVLGFAENSSRKIISAGRVSITVSPGGVRDPVYYIQAPLPFAYARDHQNEIRWCLGDLASYEKPRVVLDNMPRCGSCHTLNNFREGIQPKHFGLFPRISPDEKYEISSVKAKSVLVIRDDLRFSEFFYQASGIVAYYSEEDSVYHPLPGADNPDFIQTHPAWSANGKYVVFARANVDQGRLESMHGSVTLTADKKTTVADLNQEYPVQYNLYRVAFNGGKGGFPEPVAGASQNGMSNVFPRCSPDGKWIVFTQAEQGLMLQPGNRLMIVPFEGGVARRLHDELEAYCSFHSWSSDSRWMVFTSKRSVPYTRLYLSYIDDYGRGSPPLFLSRLFAEGFTTIAPEFIH